MGAAMAAKKGKATTKAARDSKKQQLENTSNT